MSRSVPGWTVLHLVHGGVENGDKRKLERAGTATVYRQWIVPKDAKVGDPVVIYVTGFGFFATAVLCGKTAPRRDSPNPYWAALSEIELIRPAISRREIQRKVPELAWANYPRSIHTVSGTLAVKLEELIRQRRRSGLPDLNDQTLLEGSVVELKAVAMASARMRPKRMTRTVFERLRCTAIRLYVLKRARGICEGCRRPAPFRDKHNNPFLEVHHIRRLADDGPDHPKNVAALCPNCHRRAHCGGDQREFKEKLLRFVARAEKLWE